MVRESERISRGPEEQGFTEGANRPQKTEDLKVGQFHHSMFSYDFNSMTLTFPNGEREPVKGSITRETLTKFSQKPGKVLSPDEIDPVNPKNAAKRVRRVRHEIRDNTEDPSIIIYVHGCGYRLSDGNEEIVILDTSQEQPPRNEYDNQDYRSLQGHLSFTERQLLGELITNRGNLVEKGKLFSILRSRGRSTSEGSLKYYVYSLRKKIKSIQNSPYKIVYSRGAGYMLE